MKLQSRIRYADGALDDIAGVIAGAHPRAAEYLEQAPVLAAMVAGKFGSNITYGELDQFTARVEKGPRLKEMLSIYGVAPQLRKLEPSALRAKDKALLGVLGRIAPSSLSQCIPMDSQRVWLEGVGKWLQLMPAAKRAQKAFSVEWIARRLCENLHRFEMVGALLDYLRRGGGDLNERWSWDRAMAEVTAWHDRLRDEAAMLALARATKAAASFDTVICKAPLPDHGIADGYDFHVLRTLRHLREEGATMHHCVASYAADVRRGECAVASVRKDGVNIATLEIGPGGDLRQLKAHCNRAVDAHVKTACEFFLLTYWRPDAAEKAA